jgi:predicted ATPase/class 3 adenylate cyclase
MMLNLPTGTVTFLFTDIEGSTKLAQEYADAWEILRRHHNQILRASIEAQNGYVFRIVGDAFCAAFHAAGDALRAALKSQIDLNEKPWEGPQIKVRMGIHTGRADIQEDDEYEGYLTLTRVQRVMSAAYGGQILLSNVAAELVHNELPNNVSLQDMGQHRLKGLLQPEHLWQVITAGLTQDFPPLPTPEDIPNNLPNPLTSFVGREKEITAIKQTLDTHRFVTLTGPGGIGKTRLSLEIASDLVDAFRHGAWFVELEHVKDPMLVAPTIAHVFSIQETPGRKISDALKDYLREKELLVILDNFEQVIGAVTLVKELLVTARHLKVIVTSRTPLRVAGEYEYRVPLLPLPDDAKTLPLERLAQLESVQLFVERAQSAKGDFALTPDNAPAIAETCKRLDGLPLAIELAAARVRVLPPQKMLSHLDNRLKLLTSAARDLPSRQQTLRAAIRWSYDLLSPVEQRFFRQLAVFIGGATLEAIEEVCGFSDTLELLNQLESLLDQNLIKQAEQSGQSRYDMLETIRDFADEALVEADEAHEMQARHLAFFYRIARDAEPNLVGPDELQWIMRLTNEHDNLRAAIQWGLKNNLEQAVEMICALTLFWSRGGYNEEVIGWLQLALSNPRLVKESTSRQLLHLRAQSLVTLGVLTLQQAYLDAETRFREGIALLRAVGESEELAAALAFVGYLGDLEASEESVTLARQSNNKWLLAYCLAWQSQALRVAGGDLQLARRSAAESAELSREIGSVWAVARSVLSQAQLAIALGELEEARSFLQDCLSLFSRSQDRYHANLARTELAHVYRSQGNYAEALLMHKSAIIVWHDLGLQAAVVRQLEYLVIISVALGSFVDAVRLAGAVQNLHIQIGSQQIPNEQSEYNQSLTEARKHLEPSVFNTLFAEGQVMTISEAVAYA